MVLWKSSFGLCSAGEWSLLPASVSLLCNYDEEMLNNLVKNEEMLVK